MVFATSLVSLRGLVLLGVTSALAQECLSRPRKEGKPNNPGAVIRVIQYNVLSDALCKPAESPNIDPRDTDPVTRLSRLEAKLLKEMDKGSVITMQEVEAPARVLAVSSCAPFPSPRCLEIGAII
jgi:hypothetical protein